ncbi:hypothetical protein LC048_01965 [Mesobacillus subterraneus]|uniref:hypothetical protein n=1 Tax=Mesobacillus subterraneus TaxID=285983 RepID=UPI001CFDD1BD|nr:hypothetical protein [Mesobacillus subterraneus]WLR55798.1 hypothetical protein LC048_01965 [Mesobacillus subterraneus]
MKKALLLTAIATVLYVAVGFGAITYNFADLPSQHSLKDSTVTDLPSQHSQEVQRVADLPSQHSQEVQSVAGLPSQHSQGETAEDLPSQHTMS